MANSLSHRGPDDDGLWSDSEAGIALSHRRLSILDLSAAGHQPMASTDGRFIITFNGEIYNFQQLRTELETKGHTFKGQSDTEVIAEAISEFGIHATIPRLIGMFAIAVWDRRQRSLTLVRDRLGIKPLYWTRSGGDVMFASELKAFHQNSRFQPRIDPSAAAAFLRHNYVPAPHTIYKGVFKLEPGHILTFPWKGEAQSACFWDARAMAQAGIGDQIRGSDTELTTQLEELLQDSVRRRMIADVPLGAFLSGGVDSSLVAALMQSAGIGAVKTFTVSFENSDFDEAKHAAAIAHHLGSQHTEITVTADQALDVIPKLSTFYDEPFADSSQIPTYLISAASRRHVTVALSGDGGDELFAGYNRHQFANGLWRYIHRLPLPLRRILRRGAMGLSPAQWDKLGGLVPTRSRLPQLGDKAHKLAQLLDAEDESALYRRLTSHLEPETLMPGVREHKGILWDCTVAYDFENLVDRMQFLDLVTYLPNDILTKVDRASMAVSLEVRVPLIDHRVVEFAWRLPRHLKIKPGVSKWMLREILQRHVPGKLIDRPKMGFGVPLADWLRGPLREWAETLLSEKVLRDAGLLDAATVRHYWNEHLSGKRNWQHLLWSVLMLEDWRRHWS